MKKPQGPEPPNSIRASLRDAGLRCTAARVSVVEYLSGAKSPVTHAEVAEALTGKGYDRATIYRNLIELTEAGLVSRIELGDHVWRFELRRLGEAHQAEHPHFICVACGEVSCLTSVSVSINPPPGTKQSAISRVTEVLLKGRCGQCN